MVYLSLLSPSSPLFSPMGITTTTTSSSNHHNLISPIKFKPPPSTYSSFMSNKSISIRLSPSSFSCYCSNEQLPQQTDSDDEEDGEIVVEYVADTNNSWNSNLPDTWDVLGLGQAMVPPCTLLLLPHFIISILLLFRCCLFLFQVSYFFVFFPTFISFLYL